MRSNRRSGVDISIPADVGDRFLRELGSVLAPIPGFSAQYLRQEYLSKYCDEELVPADVRRAAAISKWLAVEERNSRTNGHLLLNAEDLDLSWCKSRRLVRHVRAFVARVLGPLVYPAVIQAGVPTNGASTRVRKSPTAALYKLEGEAHISSSAIKHWLAAFSGSRMSDLPLDVVEHSVLFTVPKKSDIDRVACKEPECNMLLQRSVGNHIRARLKIFGVDLDDQTVNQRLARDAVKLGLGTVDLSSASDNVTRQLVISLLPFEWWSLLDDLRVKSTLIDGKEHQLEMFSSMGNGFTFELESLLFYALARATCRLNGVKGRISVYGDDIILPASVIPRFGRVLSFFGFKMNQKKTHYRGYFRESCGSHWWRGFDVKPFYIKRAVRTLPDLINHLNHLLLWDGRDGLMFETLSLACFWKRWAQRVPRSLWGGVDPLDNSALVTGHSPRCRLVPRARKLYRPEQGGYRLWMLARELVDTPINHDPRMEIGFVIRPLVSRGERTRWTPLLAFEKELGHLQ